MRVQETGPLIPTLRYIVPELLLAILLTLEGFKGGGPAGAAIVMILIGALLGLGSIPWTKHDIGMQTVT
ncbi:hypothetical protein DL96DRAFT_1609651 [Flagelloscypha sp. PMI_526]|nr:hypothetical protein DL96DRAFT_1609651 [Flagelloscypha sp. PMI_526]